MNISSINAHNNTSFGARRVPKGHRYLSTNKNRISKPVLIGVGTAAVGSVLALTMLLPKNNVNQNKINAEQTIPTTSYVDVLETEPYKEDLVQIPSYKVGIDTKPEWDREPVYYEVKKGDRLADIVKEYAQLHEFTPDEKLEPYYEQLELENPGLWKDRNNIYIGIRIRVDSIMPENRINTNKTQGETPIDETIPEETVEETQPQITSEEDTVILNGNSFAFDLGTLDKTITGNYQGLIRGQFVNLDKKMNGQVVLTKYAGTNAKTDVAQELTYDKKGNIEKIVDFENGKKIRTSTYSYNANTTVETVVDETSKGSQVDKVETVYDRTEDAIHTRQFYVNGKVVAVFNFEEDEVQIGDNHWILDENSFEFDEDGVGSEQYIATINGKQARFDCFKTGFAIEFTQFDGDVLSRQLYDSKGNFILEQE